MSFNNGPATGGAFFAHDQDASAKHIGVRDRTLNAPNCLRAMRGCGLISLPRPVLGAVGINVEPLSPNFAARCCPNRQPSAQSFVAILFRSLGSGRLLRDRLLYESVRRLTRGHSLMRQFWRSVDRRAVRNAIEVVARYLETVPEAAAQRPNLLQGFRMLLDPLDRLKQLPRSDRDWAGQAARSMDRAWLELMHAHPSATNDKGHAWEQVVSHLIRSYVASVSDASLQSRLASADFGVDFVIEGQAFVVVQMKTFTARSAYVQLRQAMDDGVAVVLDLSHAPDVDAKRVVDFAAGVTLGRHARLSRIDARLFAITEVKSTKRADPETDLPGAMEEHWDRLWARSKMADVG